MPYQNEEELNQFTEICDEVMNCKFIVAEVKIMKLLKCMATTPVIFNELEKCLEDFNYEFEFQKAKVPKEEGKVVLSLPVEATKKVALIFRILYDIDTKKLDLQKFINDYFVTSGEPYESYNNFCNGIIRPLMENVVYLLTGIELVREEPVVVYSEELNLTDRNIVDIMEVLKKLNHNVRGETFKLGQKEEIIIVLNGFANALLTKNPEHILVCWVGFKNTLKEYKKSIPLLKKIEEKLKKSGLFNVREK